MNTFIKLTIFIGILVFSNGTCYAQERATPDKYNRKDVMIEMRDGIKLNTVILEFHIIAPFLDNAYFCLLPSLIFFKARTIRDVDVLKME